MQARVPISAKLVANVPCAAGTNRVLTWICTRRRPGVLRYSVDHPFAAPVIIITSRA
jgi:phosphoribosylpyrophosphate synthetase